jgi:hypothetical protein
MRIGGESREIHRLTPDAESNPHLLGSSEVDRYSSVFSLALLAESSKLTWVAWLLVRPTAKEIDRYNLCGSSLH